MALGHDPQEMSQDETTVYEAIGTFGVTGRHPTSDELTEAIGLPAADIDTALSRLTDVYGFIATVDGGVNPHYTLVGRQNGPFSAV